MDAVGQLTAALIGRYTVDKEIGRGGMATVYLARDVRHNRKVALKVLNPELGAVLGVERFLAEIQVTANLQHPNLLPLFDSGEANGLLFYVMPFIEGESLRTTLTREKQVAIEDAIRIASAVASALDYAHRHGVIHRDLKPENILMHDGQPLVADFGIALAVSNAGGNRITQTGLSLGTPQYMSPEQATGDREIDGRTDIYSLGALTYEMLVGEPPHDGKTSQAIIAKILTDKPRSMRLSRETIPPHVESAVTRALAKLPADRFHTAHEFSDALTGKTFSVQAPVDATSATRTARDWSGVIPWGVAALALAVAVLSWSRDDTVAARDDRVLRYEVPIPPNVDVTATPYPTVAISPGGRYVAYVASRADGGTRVFLRTDDDLQAREVPGTEGALFAMFSPDGTQLAFIRSGQLMKVPVAGGRAELISDGIGPYRGITWSPSGWIVGSDGIRLVKMPAVGGTVTPFSQPDSSKGETFQGPPVALPDGKTVLYASLTMGGAVNSRIGVASIEDGSATILDLVGSHPLGVLDGHLIYSNAEGTLMAAPFDLTRRRVTGPSLRLADQATVSNSFGIAFASMATDGSLAYLSGAIRRQPVLVSPDGSMRLLGEACPCSWPRFSPDGRRIAWTVGNLSQRDIWLTELPAGTATPMTFGTALNDRPEWTSDGSTILFRSTEGGPRHAIWSISAAGGAAPKIVFGRADSHTDEGVLSPDGQHLLLQRDSTSNAELWYASLKGDSLFRPVVPGGGVYGGRFSPDGKWVAYTSTQGGGEQVFIKPFPSLLGQFQVSTSAGHSPVWSPDGRRIYYVSGEQLMVATIGSLQPFTIASRSVALSRGYSFFGIHADYDVARDGTILAFQPPGGATQLIVVRNLAAELRARVAGAPR